MKNQFFFPLLLMLFLFSCGEKETGVDSEEMSQDMPKESIYMYGFCVDSLEVESDCVKKNEVLSEILTSRGVDYSTVHHIATNQKKVFDIKKIRPEHKYTFLKSSDSVSKPLFWIYEIDKVDFVVFSLTDSLTARIGHKEQTVDTAFLEGSIESSLWNAIIDKGGDANLVLNLSDVYQWTVDFFGIQPKDVFKVYYERRFIEGEYVGTGRILAAELINGGVEHQGFRFKQNGNEEFFDEKGVSLRKSFLKAPLNYRRISSTFSNGRYHPVLKIVRPHHGVDYAAPSGTPVQAVGDGVIIKKAYQKGGGGNYLKIKHNSTYTTTYMHLKGYAKGIAEGKRVRQGEIIGYVGSTGVSTGPHLDFRIQKNGTYIDPLKFKSDPADPVKKENMKEFEKLVKKYKF